MGGEQGFILFLETLRSRILPGRFQPSIQFVTIDVEMLSLFYVSEFLSKEDLEILHENIECFAYGQSDLYKPIRSKVDNSLRSIDLMHFVWNIGERLDISLIDRATFIHTIFPHELKDASIKYLAKNLRTCGVCKIALDIPKTGDYHFKITKFCTV